MLLHILQELLGIAAAFFGLLGLFEFGLRGDDAQVGVMDDGVDRFWFAVSVGDGLRRLAREGAVGDLEGVEHHAGAAEVDGVGGDGVEDLPCGEADAVAILGHGEILQGRLGHAGGEGGGLPGVALAGVGDGHAGGVVVGAEVLATHAGAAATAALGEDVAALLAGLEVVAIFLGGWDLVFEGVVLLGDGQHGQIPPPHGNGAKS